MGKLTAILLLCACFAAAQLALPARAPAQEDGQSGGMPQPPGDNGQMPQPPGKHKGKAPGGKTKSAAGKTAGKKKAKSAKVSNHSEYFISSKELEHQTSLYHFDTKTAKPLLRKTKAVAGKQAKKTKKQAAAAPSVSPETLAAKAQTATSPAKPKPNPAQEQTDPKSRLPTEEELKLLGIVPAQQAAQAKKPAKGSSSAKNGRKKSARAKPAKKVKAKAAGPAAETVAETPNTGYSQN